MIILDLLIKEAITTTIKHLILTGRYDLIIIAIIFIIVLDIVQFLA